MTTISENKIKLICISNNTEHRLITFNAKALKISLWIVPIVSFFFILLFAFMTLKFYRQSGSIKHYQNSQIENINQQNEALQKQVQILNTQINDLNKKLTTPAESSNPLLLFNSTAGFKDLSDQAQVAVQNLSYSIKSNNLEVKFELHNQSGTDRMVGYFFVLTYAPGQLLFFPQIPMNTTEINFSLGETFNIGRFKNVIYQTPITATGKLKLKIIAFNRTGDLLLNQKFDLE